MTNPEHEHKVKQQTEITRKQYREAARELFPNVVISDYAHVKRTLDGDGAYVECTVWVPRPPSEVETIDGSTTTTASETNTPDPV